MTSQNWCNKEIDTFESDLNQFSSDQMFEEEHLVDTIVRMAKFANEKYRYYQQIWIEYDEIAFIVAIAVGSWTVLFNVAINFC